MRTPLSSQPAPALASRRKFLRFLAGSPLLAPIASRLLLSDGGDAEVRAADTVAMIEQAIASPEAALNVFEFEAAAKAKLPPAHWGYLSTGVEDDATLRANRTAFSKYHLRPRRLIDVRKIDQSTRLFGLDVKTPILLAPVGSQKAFHDDGETAVARAAREQRHQMILSTQTTTSVEDVNAAHGSPVWYQLYPTSSWEVTKGLIKRVQAAGCPVVMVTVDQLSFRSTETFQRIRRTDDRDCAECHSPRVFGRHKPMYQGLNTAGVTSNLFAGLTWEFVDRLRKETTLKIVLKGIVTREDAQLSVEHGVDGLLVSNHGGRAEESGWGTLDSLPEVVEAVAGKIPVLIDGGIRRGTDVFKALALGARAVCIGRPYVWGLSAFGQAGVEKVLNLLRLELEFAMKHAGTRSLQEITRSCVG
ncbi:MAG: alpha-hydroxy-acid oxidizing protein [Verrucomicrobia bacterium]|nr:alpha-hydroxy-acid oxidizing protein [Verrucomicrobiota bacterium]